MATLAPYSANRTAIAWPIPELPPGTSTFLPRRPGIASATGMGMGWATDSSSGGDCGLSAHDRAGRYTAQQHEPDQREQQDGEQAGPDQGGALGRADQPQLGADRGGGDDEGQGRRLHEPGDRG